MRRSRALATFVASLSIIAIVSLAARAEPAAPGWPQAHSDLPADPSITFGSLPNGMRYLIKPDATPPGAISLWLIVDTGSLEETDSQAGIAHFLEHVVFRGSKHFPDGEALKTLQGAGVSRGVDFNAFTADNATRFWVDLPRNDDASVDKALLVFRDIAGDALIDPKAVDSERAIVLAEAHQGDTALKHALDARQSDLLGPDLARAVSPIGKDSVIEAATADQLRAFYRGWYRPARTTLVIVGDVKPAAIESKIRALFEDWQNNSPLPVAPTYTLPASTGPHFKVFSEAGAGNLIAFSWAMAHDRTPDTRARDRRDLARILGTAILNRRLSRKVEGETAPFQAPEGIVFLRDHGDDMTILFATPVLGRVADGVRALHGAYADVLRDGVRSDELDLAIRSTRLSLQTAAASGSSIPSRALAQQFVLSISNDDVISSPQAQLELFEDIVKTLSTEEVTATLRAYLSDKGPAVFVSGPGPIEGGVGALSSAFAEPQAPQAAVQAPAPQSAWPYTDFGAPGQVVSRNEVADLGITQVTFANGVRATIKRTQFRAGQIVILARFGRGRLGLAKDHKTPGWALAPTLISGGLARIGRDALTDAATGKAVSLRLDFFDNAFALLGGTRPQDYLFELQLLTAQLTDPGWRPDLFSQVKTAMLEQLAGASTSPTYVLNLRLPEATHNFDPRWQVPTPDEVRSTKLEDVRAVFDKAFGNSSLEVTVVGDIPVDDAIKGLQETFGALPRHFPMPASLEGDERLPPADQKPTVLTHKGNRDRALAAIGWQTIGFYPNLRIPHTLRVLELVLNDRALEALRTQMGITYQPVSSTFASEGTPTFGYLGIAAETPLAKVPDFYATIAKIAADLRTNGVTAEELARLRDPHVQDLLRNRQTNEYWAGALSGSQDDPRKLDFIRSLIPDMQSITPEDLLNAARTYLVDDRAFRLVIVPEGQSGSILTMR
jgi:zinc protease